MTRRHIRWAVPALVIAVTAIIAVRPRHTAIAPPPSSAPTPAISWPQLPPPTPPCPAAQTSTPPAGPLAAVAAPCLTGPANVRLGPALMGRVTLVNLWASWCGPCRKEMPVLSAYAGEPGAVAVLGVAVKDDPRAARSLIRDLAITYPSVADTDDAIQRALTAPPVVPLSYLVLPDGTVRRITDPAVFDNAGQIRAAVAGSTESRR